RFVVPSLDALQMSMNRLLLLIHSKNLGYILVKSSLNTGKSELTTDPSSKSGTRPKAPLRASILDIRKSLKRKTCRFGAAISDPKTSLRSITPFPQSFTVTCRYLHSGFTSICSSDLTRISFSCVIHPHQAVLKFIRLCCIHLPCFENP